jgi:hypothetical protein
MRTFTAGTASAGMIGAVVALAATASLQANAGATTVPAKQSGSHTRAANPPSLSSIQAEAATAVTNRVHILNSAMARIDPERDLGNGRAALRSYLRADVQRLQQQGRVVAADNAVAQAQRDFVDIFSAFRVYHLALPAVSLVVRADRVTQTDVPALKSAAANIEASSARRNHATVQPIVEDLNRQIATATSTTQALASTVLAYTPAQWNANNGLLSAASSSVSTAEKAIRQGRSDVQHIRQDLHGGVHGGKAKAHHLHR